MGAFRIRGMLKEMVNYSIKSGGFVLKFFHFEIASEVKVHCKALGKTRQISFHLA